MRQMVRGRAGILTVSLDDTRPKMADGGMRRFASAANLATRIGEPKDSKQHFLGPSFGPVQAGLRCRLLLSLLSFYK